MAEFIDNGLALSETKTEIEINLLGIKPQRDKFTIFFAPLEGYSTNILRISLQQQEPTYLR